ncbi:MAG: argininosuccinate lyase [Candidatus Micrarchaeota archaeon]
MVMAKLWGGAFEKGPKKELIEFTSSENAKLDARLIPYDILGSEAHVAMLHKQGIIGSEDAKKILRALGKLKEVHKKGKFTISVEDEDVHTAVENFVKSEGGEAGGKMHTARSRNDQVNADMRMFLRDEINEVIGKLLALQSALLKLQKNNLQTVMPGYTHTRIAQPITFAFWCASYLEAFGRDVERLEQAYARVNVSPLGAGALAGTSWSIDKEFTAELLGFEGVHGNALDAVSSRWEVEAEVLSALALAMTHASRLSNELILYSMPGFDFVELGEEYATGSSIMPQKKNPDALELVRGRAARVYGNLFHVLALSKDLISGHNADTQETKYAVMSALDATKGSLAILAGILSALKVNKEKMKEAAEQGFSTATDLADLLARKGLPFRSAHQVVGALVKLCVKKKITLAKLKPQEITKQTKLVAKKSVSVSKSEIVSACDVLGSVKMRASGPAPESVRRIMLSRELLLEEKKNGLGARNKKLEEAHKKLGKTIEEIV